MELFTKSKTIKLRSHLDKYLVAGDDQETIRQSRNGFSSKAIWTVESIQHKNDAVRLKSCYGKYLTASDVPFLLGMTGKRALQTLPDRKNPTSDWNTEWEPIMDGFQVKLKSWSGKFLRGNGGTPPWRNSVTHDDPHSTSTRNWILWDVEFVEVPETGSFKEYLSSISSFSSLPDDVLEAAVYDDDDSVESPRSVMTPRRGRFLKKSSFAPKFQSIMNQKFQTGMDYFKNAKAVRLRSHNEKFLIAEDDEESVCQGRNGSSKEARWTVEYVPESASTIRLKSCYGKYLTASDQHFLMGAAGHKVVQTMPARLDSSVEWEPVREGWHVKLKTRYGNFLRANGGLPPWRNSVTHDIPHRTSSQESVFWDVDVVEIHVNHHEMQAPKTTTPGSDSLEFESDSPSSVSEKTDSFSESIDSHAGSPPKPEGRTIYYHVCDESGVVNDEGKAGYALKFKGNGVEELTQKLKEELEVKDIVVCTRSPLNGKLYPLRLRLPPNNADMHVVVVPLSSQLAGNFAEQGITS